MCCCSSTKKTSQVNFFRSALFYSSSFALAQAVLFQSFWMRLAEESSNIFGCFVLQHWQLWVDDQFEHLVQGHFNVIMMIDTRNSAAAVVVCFKVWLCVFRSVHNRVRSLFAGGLEQSKKKRNLLCFVWVSAKMEEAENWCDDRPNFVGCKIGLEKKIEIIKKLWNKLNERQHYIWRIKTKVLIKKQKLDWRDNK